LDGFDDLEVTNFDDPVMLDDSVETMGSWMWRIVGEYVNRPPKVPGRVSSLLGGE
jgi:hypothetical protein